MTKLRSLAGGPETVELGNFDPVGMLNDWEAAFLARDADEILDGGRPTVGGGARVLPLEESGVLIAVSPDLVTDPAEANEARLAEIRGRWLFSRTNAAMACIAGGISKPVTS